MTNIKKVSLDQKPIKSLRKSQMDRKIIRQHAQAVEAEMGDHTKEEAENVLHSIKQEGEAYTLGDLDKKIVRNYVFNKGLHGCGKTGLGDFKDLFLELLNELDIQPSSLPVVQKIKVCDSLTPLLLWMC